MKYYMSRSSSRGITYEVLADARAVGVEIAPGRHIELQAYVDEVLLRSERTLHLRPQAANTLDVDCDEGSQLTFDRDYDPSAEMADAVSALDTLHFLTNSLSMSGATRSLHDRETLQQQLRVVAEKLHKVVAVAD